MILATGEKSGFLQNNIKVCKDSLP
jgi:hypothetical protein